MNQFIRFALWSLCVLSCVAVSGCEGCDEGTPDANGDGDAVIDGVVVHYDVNGGDAVGDVSRDMAGVDTAGTDSVSDKDVITWDTQIGDVQWSDLAAYDIYREDTTWYDLGPKDDGPIPDYGQCANPGSCQPCGYGSVTGMTCAPNMTEVTAMPYVHVWIETVDCAGNPIKIEDYSDYAGYYRLDNVPCGTQTVYMQKGNFNGNYSRWVDKCVTNDFTSSDLCFPGQPARIAVVTGKWDQIEKLLIKLWFKHHQYDGLMESAATALPPGGQLLAGDSAKTNTGKGPYELIDDYDILFINCGDSPDLILNLAGGDVVTTLRDFVKKGGSVYASDWASVYLTAAWPEALSGLTFHRDFPGSAGTTPRTVVAELVDEDLAAYMGKSTANVDYRLGPLTSIVGTVPAGVRVHVRGPNSAYGNAVQPFFISFEPYGESGGRVVYTNFHNDEQLTVGDMTEVLQYVVFMM